MIRYGWVVLWVMLGVLPVAGFIDPHFTPVDLLQGATAVIAARPALGDDQVWRLIVSDRLKGDSPETIRLILDEVPEAEFGRMQEAFLAGQALGDGGAIAYVGEFEGVSTVHLHVGNLWIEASLAEGDGWVLQGPNPRMVGTYDGSTEALLRITRYLLSNPDGSVPVTVGMRWLDRSQAGQAPGPVHGMLLVDPFGTGEAPHVHIYGAGGDSIWRVNGDDSFTDVTAETALQIVSRHAAWLRWPGQASASLVSAGDKRVRILDVTDGRFEPRSAFAVEGDVLGIAGFELSGQPAILVSLAGVPVIAHEVEDGWRLEALPVGDTLLAAAGSGAAALVADFNNDGYIDVLQPRAHHGLLWRGGASGFNEAIAVAVVHGGSSSPAVALGDWNADGLLDVFVSGLAESELWQQEIDGSFRRVAKIGGSMSYKAHPAAAAAKATDLNHDGRPDLAIFYETRTALYHFNRGYGAMGEEGELPLDAGLVAAVAADMNADSSLDLLAVRRDGTLVYMSNDLFDVPSLTLRLGEGLSGPVTVSVWQGQDQAAYCVGTVLVESGRPSFVALRNSGRAQIRWRLPGQAESRIEVEVSHTAKTFTIEP